jgi:peroxiredoxin
MADVAMRSAFLIEDGNSIVASWMLGRELPDVDAVIEAARA